MYSSKMHAKMFTNGIEWCLQLWNTSQNKLDWWIDREQVDE